MAITGHFQVAPTTQQLSGNHSPADWKSSTRKWQMLAALLLDI